MSITRTGGYSRFVSEPRSVRTVAGRPCSANFAPISRAPVKSSAKASIKFRLRQPERKHVRTGCQRHEPPIGEYVGHRRSAQCLARRKCHKRFPVVLFKAVKAPES